MPGGLKLDTPEYPHEQAVPPIPSTPTPQTSLEQVEKDLSAFFWQGVHLNRILVRITIDKLWGQLMSGAVPLPILTGSEANNHSEKMHAMKSAYKIDDGAIRDVDFLESMTKEKPRSDLMNAYNKAGFLMHYLAFVLKKGPRAE